MEYPIEYVPESRFVRTMKARMEEDGEKRELIAIDGKNRWLMTREDGSKYILRPQTDE